MLKHIWHLHPDDIWTINLKSFEIRVKYKEKSYSEKWTINLKSFEIAKINGNLSETLMNYKLEKFWNNIDSPTFFYLVYMNYKLEKFWNWIRTLLFRTFERMNYKLEKFWNKRKCRYLSKIYKMNYKLEKFWNLSISFQIFIKIPYEL